MYDPKCGTYVKSNRKTSIKYDFRVFGYTLDQKRSQVTVFPRGRGSYVN